MDLINVEKHIPWVVFDAKDWLETYLKGNMKVFEWGSGGSTLYFAKKVAKIISVEHDEAFYKEVSNVILKENIKNCEYFLIKPIEILSAKYLLYDTETYTSRTFKEYRSFHFRDYVKKIDSFSDNYFDLILIDGRSRASCIKHSIKKIKIGGFLVLDNSEREDYKPAMKLLNKFNRTDFFGHGPYIKEPWQTTIWKIC